MGIMLLAGLGYFAFAFFMGLLAKSKDRSFTLWFIVSVFASPPVALLLFIATA